jgi:hypothetical protein
VQLLLLSRRQNRSLSVKLFATVAFKLRLRTFARLLLSPLQCNQIFPTTRSCVAETIRAERFPGTGATGLPEMLSQWLQMLACSLQKLGYVLSLTV